MGGWAPTPCSAIPTCSTCWGSRGPTASLTSRAPSCARSRACCWNWAPGSPSSPGRNASVGKDDFYLDRLFFHRHLRRLIAVELKLESFQPAHVGQMELYLRWLDKHERAPGEESPIGLILCASADAEQVELLQLNAKSIRVSEYLTELPPLPLLRARLHEAIEHAREQA